MIANCEVEIFTGAASENDWGDVTFTEGAPTVVPGHIGAPAAVIGRSNTESDGITVERVHIRIPSDVPVILPSTVFRINGIRWKPLSVRIPLFPQRYALYNCQRIS